MEASDIFLVSYPKSGNTWLRFLLGNYLTGNKCDFLNSHLIVPDIHYNPNDVQNLAHPRVIKSHNRFDANYRRIIYLARDGRDVAVSYYYHYLKFLNTVDLSFRDFLTEFNSGAVNFGIWNDHVISWLDSGPSADAFMVTRYEDLLRNPHTFLEQVLRFIGFAPDLKTLESTIKASSFANMKRLENGQTDNIDLLSKSNQNVPFVRSGKQGQWEQYFTTNMMCEFLEVHGKALSRLGYV